jgi:hypothetical protein
MSKGKVMERERRKTIPQKPPPKKKKERKKKKKIPKTKGEMKKNESPNSHPESVVSIG